MTIETENFLNFTENNLQQYKLHLACFNGIEQPLDVFQQSWDKWVNWNEWRGNKDDFDRPFMLSLIQYYHEPNKWLFGGIFKVVKRFDDWPESEIGYELDLVDLHKELIGRLIIDFHRTKDMRGRTFLLEDYYKGFVVSEILENPFNEINR